MHLEHTPEYRRYVSALEAYRAVHSRLNATNNERLAAYNETMAAHSAILKLTVTEGVILPMPGAELHESGMVPIPQARDDFFSRAG
jgi:hypothetical protein